MEMPLVRLQVLGWSRREVDREACKLDIPRPVVDETQIPKATARMFPAHRVGAQTLTHGEKARGVSASAGHSLWWATRETYEEERVYMGSSRPSEAVASLPFPLIHRLDSVKVSHTTASGE